MAAIAGGLAGLYYGYEAIHSGELAAGDPEKRVDRGGSGELLGRKKTAKIVLDEK